MTDKEKQVIRDFAAGSSHLRKIAIEIHRRNIEKVGVRRAPEQDFMAEVDNPTSKSVVRTWYRKKLLDA